MQICFVFYPTKETWDPRFYKSNKSQAPYCVPLSAVLLWALHINIHPSSYPNSTPVFYASELLSVPEHVLFNFFTPAPLCLEFYLAIVFVHFGSCLFFKLVFYEIFPSCLLWQDNKPFLCSTYIYVSIFAKHYPDKNYLFTHDRELQEWGGGPCDIHICSPAPSLVSKKALSACQFYLSELIDTNMKKRVTKLCDWIP